MRHTSRFASVLFASATFLVAETVVASAAKMIVYVSATDCVYCRQFEAQYQKKYNAACHAKGIVMRQVTVAKRSKIRSKEYWPADLRPLLKQFSDKGGTPRFLVVENGKLIDNIRGTSGWRNGMNSAQRICLR